MKLTRVACKTLYPEVIAKGVKGGGYIIIYTTQDAPLSNNLADFSDKPKEKGQGPKFGILPFMNGNKFWLKEDEELYGCGTYYEYNNSINSFSYTVVYLDPEPSNQSEPAPINLTGTIQLNQQ